MIFLDLSAAFDTVDHSTLLRYLQNCFGVGGSGLKCFMSHLIERYQSIKIGSTLSDFFQIPVLCSARFCFGLFDVFIVNYSSQFGQ